MEIFELLLLGKLSEAFSTKTPPQISPSNFTTRFWVVAGPIISAWGIQVGHLVWVELISTKLDMKVILKELIFA